MSYHLFTTADKRLYMRIHLNQIILTFLEQIIAFPKLHGNGLSGAVGGVLWQEKKCTSCQELTVSCDSWTWAPKTFPHRCLAYLDLQTLQKFIYNNGRGEKALSDYEKFCSKEGLFGDEDFLSLDPANYWDLLQSDHAELSKIALQFVLLPASTASLERAFSMWSYVHNKIRNRLGLETSEKLLFCYHTINTLKK